MENLDPNYEHDRPALEFQCARCSRIVRICQCCWRNQKYCSHFCSHEATKERHRRNQQAYRQTVAGKENHKVHQKTYRARKKIPRVIDLQS